MSRETKVGLVIAGSFLCLVAVVVAARMRQADDTEPMAQVVTPKDEQQSAETKPKAQQQQVVPAKHSEEKPSSPSDALPTPPVLPEAKNLPVEPPPISAPSVEKTKIDEDQQQKLKALSEAVNNANPSPIPGKPVDLPRAIDPPPPSLPSTNTEPPAPMVMPPPAKDNAVPVPPAPDPMVPKASDPVVPPAPDVTKLELNKKVPDTPPNPLPPVPEPMLPSVTLTPKETKPTEPIVAPPSTPNPPASKDPPVPPIVMPPKNESTTSIPPLGSELKAISPPITIGPSKLPKVREFDVLTYICQPEDASFASISQRYFRNEKYAEALLQYNREHFLGKQELGATPTQVRPNQKVYIPPAEILEARYPNLIGSRPQGNVAPSPIKVLPPQGNNAVSPTSLIGRPTGMRQSTPTKDPTKTYRVPAQGQHILDIARQTLGDHRRWQEIYRLNGNIRPEAVIPGGTEILLPASANVQ